ncbi:HlyD family secretion protein [Pedobacter sp. MC2016-24]|uniref:HlyD family secretion protein n=1 Tax=Pedobacter sp. MC2016-24 TaxID=2780090 RepID=UPI0018828DCC|nr:HlyD family secretion protein [Pedobacter sp. MC2016-24]MBE9601585.1 HlyD family secretion protein [Pedobacter sp. MC2016-24]
MNNLRNIIYLLPMMLMMASCSTESTDNAQLEADISPVIPRINGMVTKIRVSDNQQVKEGDTLVLLDDAASKIAVAQAAISLSQAQHNVSLAGNNKNTANVNVSNVTANADAVSANLSASNAAIESAAEQLLVASKNFERYQNLLQQKSATQQQFDQAKITKAEAEARLKTAKSQKNALLKQIDASRLQITSTQTLVSNSSENIRLAELAVEQARNSLDAAKLQLSYCTIVAPADGIVSKKNVQIGQVVAPGQPLMAVTDNKKVWVVANFKETQVEKMKPGQEATIKVDAYPDEEFKGHVESIAQATGARFSFLPADNATGNFVKVTQRIPVKIVLGNSNNKQTPLRPGMSVFVKVKTK